MAPLLLSLCVDCAFASPYDLVGMCITTITFVWAKASQCMQQAQELQQADACVTMLKTNTHMPNMNAFSGDADNQIQNSVLTCQ